MLYKWHKSRKSRRTQNEKNMKKLVALMLTLAVCLSLNAVVFAQDTEINADAKTIITEEVTPRTIVGSASSYINGYGEFRVNCSGWSLWGQVTVSVNTSSGNRVVVDIEKPNGKPLFNGLPLIFNGSDTQRVNLASPGESYYLVKVQTQEAGATVSVSFGDR